MKTHSYKHKKRHFFKHLLLIVAIIALVTEGIGYRLMGQTQAQSLPTNCFHSPGACGYPDPNYNNNTGSTAVGVADCAALPTFSTSNLPAGTYYSGSGDSLEITGNNVTINNLNMGNFTIYVSSGVNNFTFKNSCIQAGDGTEDSIGVSIASGATNTTLENDTIRGAGTNIASSTTSGGTCTPGAGVSNGALGVAVANNGTGTTINGVYVYDAGSGAPGAGGGTNTTVENSYEVVNTIPACEHDEPIYFSDATITLHNNVLINEEDQTAAVFGNTYTSGNACSNSLTMTDNLVAGGDYVIYPCANAGSVGTAAMDIEGNRFARCLTLPLVNSGHECSGSGMNGGDSHGLFPSGGFYGVATDYYTGTGQTWSGNYWDDNLDQVNIDGTSGAPVANPGPGVAIAGPNSGTYISKKITISAIATAASSATVHDVQFQVDGSDITSCDPIEPAFGSTYVCTAWDSTTVADGSHILKVIATDSSGQTANSSETITVNNHSSGPLSIWSNSDTPVNGDTTTDSTSINVGVKFQSSEAGYVLGVRFYKGVGNTGTHVGALWSSGGTLLASATFANETASGWQEVFFSAPVAISANTTYVISYYAPNGNYAADKNYFASSITNGPLTALQNNDSNGDGGNGVYTYVAANGFPSSTYNAANYWVDPVFSNSQYTVPLVSVSTPASGAVLKGVTSIAANVIENGGAAIKSVQFQVDGSNIGNCDPTSPSSGSSYVCSTWDTTGLSNGTHTVQALVTDANNAVTLSGETVTVNNPTPTVSLQANPVSISTGANSTLTWGSTNATSCLASGAWSGSQVLNNSTGYTVSPSQTSTYTLTCSGGGGKAAASATVKVETSFAGQLTVSSSSSDSGVAIQATRALTGEPLSQQVSSSQRQDGSSSPVSSVSSTSSSKPKPRNTQVTHSKTYRLLLDSGIVSILVLLAAGTLGFLLSFLRRF